MRFNIDHQMSGANYVELATWITDNWDRIIPRSVRLDQPLVRENLKTAIERYRNHPTVHFVIVLDVSDEEAMWITMKWL